MTSKDTLRKIHVLQDHVVTDLLDTLTDKNATILMPFVNSQPTAYHPSFRMETKDEKLIQTFSCRSYYSLFKFLRMYPLNLIIPMLESLLIIPPQIQSTLFVSNSRSVVVNQVAYNAFNYNTTSSSEFLQNLEKVEIENSTVTVPLYRKLSYVYQILFSIFLVVLPLVNWFFLYGLVMVPFWTTMFFILNAVYSCAFFIVAIILTKKYHYNPKTLWNTIRSIEFRCQMVLMFCNTIFFYVLMGLLLSTLLLPFLFIILSMVIDGFAGSAFHYGGAVFGWSSLYGIASFQLFFYYLALLFYPSTPGNQFATLKLYFGHHAQSRKQEVVLKAVDAEEAKSLLLKIKSDTIKVFSFDVDSYEIDVGNVKPATVTTNVPHTGYSPLLNEQPQAYNTTTTTTYMYQSGVPVQYQPPQTPNTGLYPYAQ